MIEAYEFGRITVHGRSYSSDVIVYPDRVDASWWRKEGHELSPDDIGEILKAAPEVLVVGQGASGCMKVLPETGDLLREKGIELRSARTDQACTIFNDLSRQDRKVVAALHLTC